EDDREMARFVASFGVLQKFPKHVAEAGHCAGRQPIGCARERRQRVVGAKDEARSVDEIQVITRPDAASPKLIGLHCGQWASASPRARASIASGLSTKRRSQ